MKKDTIEFATVAEYHSIRMPDGVPSGVPVRVVLMWEPVAATADRLKDLFASLTEGLTDADLTRFPLRTD